ncbi:hypothetical protein Bhyg_07383 [Pseudolycoriella hygida]|uniref:Uncharacterized protein n=1 Tax=Pseudolycoriella hygida TaxID=35572 RepID=A0A9Q0S3X2_9DIPT|nr:hypothetical protein Bhyg_07383 [Pseudolycoriella hygida]
MYFTYYPPKWCQK